MKYNMDAQFSSAAPAVCVRRSASSGCPKNLYRYIRELVARAKPDLIFITGDITCGEFDDTGRSQTEFIGFMEQFGIPAGFREDQLAWLEAAAILPWSIFPARSHAFFRRYSRGVQSYSRANMRVK